MLKQRYPNKSKKEDVTSKRNSVLYTDELSIRRSTKNYSDDIQVILDNIKPNPSLLSNRSLELSLMERIALKIRE